MKESLDLFSGIGGFALGLEKAGIRTKAFCEIDTYATKVLNKNFPDTPVHKDVSKLDGKKYKGIFCIAGGFPCQDVSVSNINGKGLKGKRSGLWVEFKRIIHESEAEFAIIENVANLRSKGLATVLKDLWQIGYDAEWNVIPAQAVGAEHERERIWIIAYPNSAQFERGRISSRIQQKISELSDLRWGKDKPGVVRTLNGVPDQMDRLRCLGNAVVPEIPRIIGESILEVYND